MEWIEIDKLLPQSGVHIYLYRPEIQFVGYYTGESDKWVINAPGLPIMNPAPTHWAILNKSPVG